MIDCSVHSSSVFVLVGKNPKKIHAVAAFRLRGLLVNHSFPSNNKINMAAAISPRRIVLSSLVVVLVAWLHTPCNGFMTWSRGPMTQTSAARRDILSRFLSEEDSEENMVIMGNSELDEEVYQQDETSSSSGEDDSTSALYRALEARQKALQEGVGKRFIVRTQRGFLNVHYEPGDPYNIDNIVGHLEHGQIITSTGPMRGFWIPHDGGWSISKFGGFTWLEPIDE